MMQSPAELRDKEEGDNSGKNLTMKFYCLSFIWSAGCG